MATIVDYRTLAFDVRQVGDSGKYLGRTVYWKLYAIENFTRVLIHSVLSIQIGPDWWALAVDREVRRNANSLRSRHAAHPLQSVPGTHDIFFTVLSDLNKIIVPNVRFFRPVIPSIDQWILQLENVRIPRNIVGHMNWLSAQDKLAIDEAYMSGKAIMRELKQFGLNARIP